MPLLQVSIAVCIAHHAINQFTNTLSLDTTPTQALNILHCQTADTTSMLSLNNLRLQQFQFIALTPMIIASVSELLVSHRKLRCHHHTMNRPSILIVMCFPMFWHVLRFSCLNSCTVQPQPHNKHNGTLCNQYCASLAYCVHDCTCTGSLLQWYPKLTCNMSGHRRAVRMLFQPSKG